VNDFNAQPSSEMAAVHESPRSSCQNPQAASEDVSGGPARYEVGIGEISGLGLFPRFCNALFDQAARYAGIAAASRFWATALGQSGVKKFCRRPASASTKRLLIRVPDMIAPPAN
jgi:hypothetical protein